MRIISKFKDYYDGCMRYGMDKSLVYLRKQNEFEFKRNETEEYRFAIHLAGSVGPRRVGWRSSHNAIESIISGAVFFCGKTYNYVYVESSDYSIYNSAGKGTSEHFYSYESFEKYFSKYKKSFALFSPSVKLHFKQRDATPIKAPVELFVEKKTPCFAIGHGCRITEDPCLKDYQFYKVFDAFTTYQELDMYLRNELCDNSHAAVPVGSDVVIAESKGYNEWSFRREPTKKK